MAFLRRLSPLLLVPIVDLQGDLGDQNYLVRPVPEPLEYASVVIWCDRFDSAIGAADLAST